MNSTEPLPDLFGQMPNTWLRPLAGVDEVGRGPWAGPVLAAAVILDPNNIPQGLADSKKLKAVDRDRLALEIRQSALSFAIGAASVAEIDQLNILQATFLAMRRALRRLSVIPAFVVIDGNKVPPNLKIPAQAIVKGDGLIPEISAASIIAKTCRDQLMERLDTRYPGYHWGSNAGYGTVAHHRALLTIGATKHHRCTFAPVRKILESLDKS